MPLMRIRSVEIVFEDEMSACTDTGVLDRSVLSDSSDDSTRCADYSERLQGRDSVTLNADDFSDDNSISLKENACHDPKDSSRSNVQDDTQVLTETLPIEDVSLSLLVSEMGDSGRFTEDPGSSCYPASFETVPVASCEDALLSRSLDVISVETASTVPSTLEISDLSSLVDDESSQLAEPGATLQPLAPLGDEDPTVCDTSDLQYDSFVDLGKF